MCRFVALVILLTACGPAFCWNDHGHMVIARLAWNKLMPEQRGAVIAILKKHPHYEEFLATGKPEGFSTDEWAFMRAACWADWVRSHHAREFNHGPWHYINYPVTFAGGGVDPEKHQPPADQENAVRQMGVCMEKIRTGTDTEKAVFMTWLFHLVGDIHQPLHCVALFSDKYPDGDRGGNLIRIRIRSSPTNLHSFWDGLLGRGLTPGTIGKDVVEIEKLLAEKPELVKTDLEANTSFDSWAREGAVIARKSVYLDGDLLEQRVTDNEGVFQTPDDYAPTAGRIARVQVGKAGVRLAAKVADCLR